MQGPDQFLNDLGIELTCAVYPKRPAVVDAAHRVLVNYEAYYVSDEKARATFLDTPHQYTGRLTDPVTRERFSPAASSPRRDRAERIFYFASAETAARFDKDPERFSTPMPTMVPVAN